VSIWNTNETIETQDLSLRFSCLPAMYILIVAMHSLGGSCTNRHYTPSPPLGRRKNQHKRGSTSHEQSTRVVFRDLSRGIGTKTSHKSPIGVGDKHHPPLNDHRCSKPSRWRQPPKSNNRIHSQYDHVPLDAPTRCKCTLDHSQLT
jgi:hypothetical protein